MGVRAPDSLNGKKPQIPKELEGKYEKESDAPLWHGSDGESPSVQGDELHGQPL